MKEKLLLIAMVFTLLLTSCGQPDAPRTPVETASPTAMAVEPTGSTAASTQEMQVQAKDVTLHVRVAGEPDSGNVLVAINGGPGLSSHYMLNLEQIAGPEFAVVTYDQRGTGRSTAPAPDAANYDLLAYAEDLDAVQKAVGVERVHLLGHSWGGVVAMHYATVYPERVRSLVLVGSGPPTWAATRDAQVRLGRRIQELQREGVIPQDLPDDSGEQMQAILPAYFSDPTFTFSPADGEPPEHNQTVNELTWSAIKGYDLTDEVAKLDHRVLILWGEDDPFDLPMAEATRQALTNAEVEFVVLEKCGHFWHECQDAFYPRVRAFLGLPAESSEPLQLSPTSTAASQGYLDAFEAVWQTVNDTYFDPTFGGLDWNEVHDRYRPLVAGAADDETFYDLINQMLFELNVSHIGAVPPDELQQIDPVLSAEGSIGIDVRLINGDAVITSVEPGSPGAQAGLRPGFVIQSSDGNTIEQISEETIMIPPLHDRNRRKRITSAILGHLYGPPETSISIVYLDEQGETHTESIVRAERAGRVVLDDSLPPFFIDFEAKRLDGDIGYIRFNAFLPPVDTEFPQAIESMSDTAGLIIDLRGNHGGVFFVRKALAEKLVGEPTLFWRYERRDGIREVYLEPAERVYEGPVVVLIDVLSISSAEEFAGGLQAIGRAVIVGERSPGIVVVMATLQLPNGATLIHPVERTLTADGLVLEGHGVTPDIEVALDRSLLLQGIDSQLEAAIAHILSRESE